MQIKGPNFKVNTLDTGNPTDPAEEAFGETQQESVEDYFEDSFGDPLANGQETSESESTDPMDDYFVGMDPAADAYGDSTSWLENFPPSVNELIAQNEDSMGYLDILKGHYEKGLNDLFELKQSYEATLVSGGISAQETKMLNDHLALVNTAIMKSEQEIGNLHELVGQMENSWKQEFATGKDLNNDGWLGKPYAKGSLMIQINADNSITYIDAVSKKAVPCPIRDSDYEPQLTGDGAMEVINAEDAANFNGAISNNSEGKLVHEGGDVDAYLKLTEEAINGMGSRRFNAACDISIPQYVWVERNQDPDSSETYSYQDDELTGSRMKMADWTNEGGAVKQALPGDMTQYIQAEVTRFEIRSIPTGLTDAYNQDNDNNQIYHHVIEMYDGMDLIGRMRIEGFESTGLLATDTAETTSYAAASSFSFAFNGDLRMSEIEFKAGGLISTGRHLMEVSELEKYVGAEPVSDHAKKAYHETFDAFTKKNYVTEYYDGTDWEKNETNDFSDIYGSGNYGDGYLDPSKTLGENDTALEFRTGVFVDGLRGIVQGTGYNDVIVSPPVNEHSTYAEEHMAANAQKIKKGDAFYSNVVESQGGNDAVVCGRGDNYIIGATFAKVEASPNDDNIISTPDVYEQGFAENQIKGRNPKVYIDVQGGAITMIDMPNEMDSSVYEDPEDKNDVEKWDDAWIDDFINCTSKSVGFSNDPLEGEYVGSAKPSKLYKMNTDQALLDAQEMMGSIQEDLNKEPEIDEAQIEATWDEVMTQKSSLDDEMNGFFESMFGELNLLMGEMDVTEDDLNNADPI